MHVLIPLACLAALLTTPVLARGGGGGFREGGMEEARTGGEVWRDGSVQVDRQGVDRANVEFTGQDGRSADAEVTRAGDAANVKVTTADGKTYDAAVVGPEGFRNGYIYRNGTYVAVNLEPAVPYLAPFGAFAGWSVVTQPDYVQYPVYATYPVEVAVEVALQKLGLYTGPIDGLSTSCAGAVEQYQMQNGLPVTGAISPDLLQALGIQATFQ